MSDLPYPFADIQTPSVGFLDWIRGLTKDSAKVRPLIVDTVSTSRGTIQEITRRLKKLGYPPVAYCILFDRSREHLRDAEHDVPSFAFVTKDILIKAKTWKPEVLRANIDSQLWCSLDLVNDPLREICSYHQTDSIANELRKRFDNMISTIFRIKSGKIFDNIPISNEDDFKNVILNIIIITYNSLRKYSVVNSNDIEYLSHILEIEERSAFVCSILSRILEKEMTSSSSILSPRTGRQKRSGNPSLASHSKKVTIDMIRTIFAINYRKINEIKDKYYKKYKEYIESMKYRSYYTEEELKEMAEKADRDLYEIQKRRVGREIEYTAEQKKEMRELLLDAYRDFNKVFGKKISK